MSDSKTQSEESLVQGHFVRLAQGYPGALGLKDDCAVLTPPPGAEMVITTDPVREGVHFFADDAPTDIAWKALAVNVSDLAAKGARPLSYVMALSFPQFPQEDWLREFAAGLSEAQAAFGMHLIGGDTDRAAGPLSVAITAFGSVPTGTMVKRSGARAGDLLFVSGSLGNSTFGLQLRRDQSLAKRWDLSEADVKFLLAHYLAPQPRLALRLALRDYANAAMDLSDGLVKDAGRMCRASQVGATLNIANVPTSDVVTRILISDPEQRQWVITGGDDYEILSSVPPQNERAFVEAAQTAGIRVSKVGCVKDGDSLDVFDSDGTPLVLPRTGWDHF